tara:strand:- start:6704 stop:6973 length:270 start_codon:yes stop_codon:yes gene_type:complete
MTKSYSEILEQRHTQYGDATLQHSCAEDMATVIEDYINGIGVNVESADIFTVRMLCLKITRMISNPKHLDNYDDIMGYTELMKRRYKSE